MAFFCRNWSRINSLRQQAYYNANSGVEYARFIIEHSPAIYNPLDPTGALSSKTPWPLQGSIPCTNGTTVISIVSDGAGGYNISSTGTLGSINSAIQKVHYVGGKIEEWN